MTRIVVKAPGDRPEVVVCEGEVTLAFMQKAVGGYIERVVCEALPPGTSVYCNEEGKLQGLSPNFAVWGDVVVGSVIAVGEDEEGDTRSLTEDEATAICRALTRLGEPWTSISDAREGRS